MESQSRTKKMMYFRKGVLLYTSRENWLRFVTTAKDLKEGVNKGVFYRIGSFI